MLRGSARQEIMLNDTKLHHICYLFENAVLPQGTQRCHSDPGVPYLRLGSLPALCCAEGPDSGPGNYCVRQHRLSGLSV